jgi:tetratricopeptide (TPR) repeat protein
VACLEGELLHERFGQSTPPAVLSRVFLAWPLAEVGRFTEGIAIAEEGLRIAEAINRPLSLLLTSYSIGLLHFRKGDLHQALPPLERAMGICQEADLPLYFPRVALPLGLAHALSGRFTDALSLLEQAVERGPSVGRMVEHSLRVARLAEALLLAGRLEDASPLAQEALALSRTHKERGTEAYALRLLGDIAVHHDPPDADQAETHYHQALALAEDLGMRPLQAHCYRGLGMLYRQIGQAEQARAELSTAIEMYRDMDMTFWLPETEAALAEVEV